MWDNFVPNGVHFFIITGPNTASLTILHASFPVLDSLGKVEFLCSTTSIGMNTILSMSELGSVPTIEELV